MGAEEFQLSCVEEACTCITFASWRMVCEVIRLGVCGFRATVESGCGPWSRGDDVFSIEVFVFSCSMSCAVLYVVLEVWGLELELIKE